MTCVSNDPMNLAQTRALMRGLMDLVVANMARIQACRYEITIKPDGSPVTASDVLIEDLIHQYLITQIPDITFAGEETFSSQTRLRSVSYYAILDPIDGTENFCSGLDAAGRIPSGVLSAAGTHHLGQYRLWRPARAVGRAIISTPGGASPSRGKFPSDFPAGPAPNGVARRSADLRVG